MSKIIDGSSFLVRPYRIPDQESYKDFSKWLDDQERDLCDLLLGKPLRKELFESLDTSSPEERFELLVNGDDEQFDGLIKILVPAIYSYWLDPNQFKLTAAGIVTNQQPQGSIVLDNNIAFEVQAWNDFVKKVGQPRTKDETTFWFYMNQHKDDFSNWKFTPQESKNRYI